MSTQCASVHSVSVSVLYEAHQYLDVQYVLIYFMRNPFPLF